jgi:hypothetical protein
MKNLLSLLLLTVVFSLVACTPPQLQKLKNLESGYQQKTGISVAQTGGLLWDWWGDFNRAKAENVILETQASPVTSTK